MKKRTARRAFLVPGVIIIGIVIMVALIMGRRPPEQVDDAPSGVLVDVFPAEKKDQDILITGYGEVAALHTVNLTPQVGGKVEWVHPNFLAGGVFNKGDVLVRIEPADYELAVQQAEAAVAQARYNLEVTEANAEVARTEWELIKGANSSDKPNSLVLYEPQLRQAKANMQSAQAALAMAQLNLDRTVLRAPFNCRVANENVSPGQLVGQQSVIATLFSTDVAEIEVSLQPSELAYIDIPGAKVDVVLSLESGSYHFDGYVDREVGIIGQMGRLSRVIVRIDDPFKNENMSNPALSIGSFVETRIHGRIVRDIISVPRTAVRSNNQIWVAQDSVLTIRDIDVYYKSDEVVLVNSGLETGELVVLTQISGAANGMKLRPQLPEAGE